MAFDVEAPAPVVAAAAVTAAACWWRRLADPDHFAGAPLLAGCEWSRDAVRLAEREPDLVLAELDRHFEEAHTPSQRAVWRRTTARFAARGSVP